MKNGSWLILKAGSEYDFITWVIEVPGGVTMRMVSTYSGNSINDEERKSESSVFVPGAMLVTTKEGTYMTWLDSRAAGQQP